MPPVSEFMQFLASSITFMVHLKDVVVFFDHDFVGQINKSLGQSQDIPISTELKQWSPGKNMIVKSVQKYRESFQPLYFAYRFLHPTSHRDYSHDHAPTIWFHANTRDKSGPHCVHSRSGRHCQ
jgi:hypothetical protein